MEELVARGSLQGAVENSNSEAQYASLESTTWAAASSAFNSWIRFCKLFKVDYSLGGSINSEKEYDYREVVKVLVQYIGFEVGVRKLSPDSICGAYIYNIINKFIANGWDTELIDKAMATRQYKFYKRGYKKIYNRANPKSLKAKIAFELSMLLKTIKLLKLKFKLERSKVLALELGLFIGLFFLLRKSEYLKCSGKGKGMKFNQITFFDEHGVEISFDKVGVIKANRVHVNIPFSKTDQHGYGRILEHIRQEGHEACIVTKIESWFMHARNVLCAKESDYIFMNLGVDGDMISQVMKWGTKQLGLNPNKISAHSLRYGGATMLAAAGLPQYIIAWYGGWTADSTVMRLYATLGNDAISLVTSTMCNQSNKCLADLIVK